MKTSTRKYNKRYGVCRSHVKLTGLSGSEGILTYIYECPTCGKSYGVQYDIRGCTEEPFASILSLMEIVGGEG